jgi:fructan beta-fructosidase
MARIALTIVFLFAGFLNSPCQSPYHEALRPQLHFSPQAGWMNDPNGLVYFKDEYHMFFQYYPDSTVWGPMHWGHSVSKDLIHWNQEPIALFPDTLGYIFSGSAVVDERNSSGLGKNGNIPLVAIFTQHDPVGEKTGSDHFQNQSIAYSLDEGMKWVKYFGNPVLKSPSIKDFRDPKVSWNEDHQKWIMTLSAGNRIQFYSSGNLRNWTKESDFGSGLVPSGRVWECPDLISFDADGKKIWMLLVSVNPGGPQGGSGTRYFTGSFDGHSFTAFDTITRWADYGPDNYAGVTFSNTGKEKIFLGWMSNWLYATKVPALQWRSAMTLPRIMSVKNIGGVFYSSMVPVDALEKLVTKTKSYKHIPEVNQINFNTPTRFEISLSDLYSFSLVFSNASGQQVSAGYDEENNSFFIDRTLAGNSTFNPQFAGKHYAPRIAQSNNSKIILILDNTSLEMFADDGLTNITDIFFPNQPFTILQQGPSRKPIEDIKISELASIWSNKK